MVDVTFSNRTTPCVSSDWNTRTGYRWRRTVPKNERNWVDSRRVVVRHHVVDLRGNLQYPHNIERGLPHLVVECHSNLTIDGDQATWL